jgi:type IV secretion system protein VirB10
MPDEQPPIPPPPQAYKPQGVISNKRKRWITAGVIGAAFLLLLFSIKTSAPAPQPKLKKPIVRTEPTELAPDPPTRTRPAAFIQAQSSPAASSYVPQSPQQTDQDRLREERRQREEKAAYESSVITRPKPEQTQPPAQTHVADTQPIPKPPANVLPEGTVIDCSLVNELNGDFVGPVIAQVSTDVYDPKTWRVVIPQGARILGEASKVSGFGQERLAVTFHRVLWNGHSLSLDKAPGLDQQGATALKDTVNNHWMQIFGASLAIGAIGGVAQIGNGYDGFGYSPEVAMRNGISQSMGQSAYQILDRFLNRLPSIKIRSGARVIVYITTDIPIPDDEDIQTANR